MVGTKTFIDFIIDVRANADPDLFKDFVEAETEEDLEAFFNNKGYAVSTYDCGKLLQAKADYHLDSWPPPPVY